jgi:thioredoxin 1
MKINAKNSSIYLLSLILSLFLNFISCESSKAAVCNLENKIASGPEYPVQNIKPPSSYDTNISYAEALKMGKPIVIEFYSDWCSHCQEFAPTLYNIRKQYEDKYTFVTLNGEKPENAQLMKEFGITSYPSVFLVNPKNNQKIRLNQDPNALKGELDKFYNANK